MGFQWEQCWRHSQGTGSLPLKRAAEAAEIKMNKIEYPLGRVYGLLEPGAVVLLTTQSKGCPNVMTMSWRMMMEFEPPLGGCIVSNRNYTFEILHRTRESVINIPSADIAKQVVACGNASGGKVDNHAASRRPASRFM
jgi:flavin reductase (DIM6/NTAB) family NADH-FMN oxidoreductase RutF